MRCAVWIGWDDCFRDCCMGDKCGVGQGEEIGD